MEADPQTDPRWAAHRLAAVGSIAALVGHKARNRLTVVRGALELLQAGMADELTPEQIAAFLGEFDRFLGDFNLGLEMIRCHPAGIKRVSARTVITEAVARCRPAAEHSAVALEFADQPGDDQIQADPLLLRLAVLNLLRNATTAVAGQRDGRVVVRSTAGNPWLIEVEDNGPGLPDDLREAFASASPRPPLLGLGLTLCRDAMTVMDGTAHYASAAIGTGAHFQLSVPAGH